MRCPQLINLQCFQLTISSSQNLKKVIFILQYRSDFYSVLARMLVKKWAKSHYFQIFSSSVLSVFKRKTCILHHFAFLDWLPIRNFPSPITHFQPLKTHFLTVILPLSAMFLMALKGFIYTIAVHFYAFRLAFCSISHCIQHQNAVHLAPKRSAFSTKLQCIQRHIARYLASDSPKSGAKVSFL